MSSLQNECKAHIIQGRCPKLISCAGCSTAAVVCYIYVHHSCLMHPDAKVRMCLVYFKYWTLNFMVYPKILFHPTSSIKADVRQRLPFGCREARHHQGHGREGERDQAHDHRAGLSLPQVRQQHRSQVCGRRLRPSDRLQRRRLQRPQLPAAAIHCQGRRLAEATPAGMFLCFSVCQSGSKMMMK